MNEEYPKEDFQKMQQQAIDRVREMQKRAVPEQPPRTQPQQRPSRFFPPGERQSDRPMHPNPPKPPHEEARRPDKQKPTGQGETCENPKEEKPQPKNSLFSGLNPLSSILNMDTDMSLILPLVMLLGKDGADDMLLLALIYIMT